MSGPDQKRRSAAGRWTTHKAFCNYCSDLRSLCAKGETLRLIATTSDREHTQRVPPDPYPDEIVRALRHAEKWVEYLNTDPLFGTSGIVASLIADECDDYLYDYKTIGHQPRFVFLLHMSRPMTEKGPPKECYLAVTVSGPPIRIVNVHRPLGTTTARLKLDPEGIAQALLP